MRWLAWVLVSLGGCCRVGTCRLERGGGSTTWLALVWSLMAGVEVNSPNHAKKDIHHRRREFGLQSPVCVSFRKRPAQTHVDQEQCDITDTADGSYHQPPTGPRLLRPKEGDNVKDDVRAEKSNKYNGLYAVVAQEPGQRHLWYARDSLTYGEL